MCMSRQNKTKQNKSSKKYIANITASEHLGLGQNTSGWSDYQDHVCVSHSVVSDSLRPHGLLPARLLCPWDSSGKNTRVGYHFLLQKILPTQGSNPGLPHCRDSLAPEPPGKPIRTMVIKIIKAEIILFLTGKKWGLDFRGRCTCSEGNDEDEHSKKIQRLERYRWPRSEVNSSQSVV